MSKSTNTAKKSSPRESQTESFPLPPSLAMSNYSSVTGTPQAIREWLMSLPRDSHAPHFPSQENKQEPTTREICGPLPLKSFALYDRDTRSWKMSEVSSPRDISKKSLKTWPIAGMMQDGVCYQQPKWERRINEIDSGLLLPTPNVPNGGRQPNLDNLTLRGNTLYREDGSKIQLDLQTHVRLWPTPSANKITGSGEIVNADGTPWDGMQKPHSATMGKPIQTALTDAVARWPTPTVDAANERKGKYKQGGTSLSTTVQFATPQARDFRTGETSRWENPNHSRNLNDQLGGKLNPEFVEWLMAWPVGWSSPEPLPPERFEQWLHGSNWWDEEFADVSRLTEVVPNRVNRLKALGNGQVSLCAAIAWKLLTEEENNEEIQVVNEIVTQGTSLADGNIGMTDEVSWTPPNNITMEQYLEIGHTFQQIQRSLSWWYGDLLNFGERKFGEEFAQAVDDSGKALETLIKYKAVADRIPREIRKAGLSWTSHFYVAYVDADQRGDLLTMALNMGLSSRELKEVVKLDYFLREDLIAASKRGIDHSEFMRLLNKLKLGEITNEKDDDEKEREGEEDIPFSDLDDNDDEEEEASAEKDHAGLNYDDVFDFWENKGVSLRYCGTNEVIWEGISVRAAIDKNNKLLLIWEEIP